MSTHNAGAPPDKPPHITIIVAVFNGVDTIQQCIDSVADQTYEHKELIIMDARSTDGTLGTLRSNQEAITYWESKPDKGIYEAWNKALRHATGDWICFLGADDYFLDEHVLERMVPRLNAALPEYRVVYGRLAIVNAAGEYMYSIGEPWEKVEKLFLQLMSIPHVGTMHHRSLFDEHGSFDETFRIAGDYELLRRELRGRKALFLPDIVMAAMRQGGISSNPGNALLQLREVRQARVMQGDMGYGGHWMLAYSRILLRLLLWHVIGEQLTRRMLDLVRRLMGRPAHWTRT
ncbi:MAG: glycosyltransferase family 2 protein [Mariprofundaceae bacterium]